MICLDWKIEKIEKMDIEDFLKLFMQTKSDALIHKLLNEPRNTESIVELTEILKSNKQESILQHLKTLTPIFLLQQIDNCIQFSINKKFTELNKILEFFFTISKMEEVCIEMMEVNFVNILIFMLHDADDESLNDDNKTLILLVLCELIKYSVKGLKNVNDLFSILIETIQNSEASLKNLAYVILKHILLNKETSDIIINNPRTLDVLVESFKVDLEKMLLSTSSSFHGLDCLDVFLSIKKYNLEEFQYIFDRRIFFKLDAEEKWKVNEIKRKY